MPQTDTPAPARGGVISPVLTIDSERLFRDSAFGQRVTREIEVITRGRKAFLWCLSLSLR